jgi:solute carrier family 7 L-type amino acid transporter-like protein
MHPEWERPIRVNMFFPIIYTIATIFITIVPMIASPIETGIGIAIILTGVPVYFIFVYWKNKPQFIQSLLANMTIVLQKLMIVVPPSAKST